MMHMMHYKLVISESKIVAACHNTSIRISEIFNVDKKVRFLFNYSWCELIWYDTLVYIHISDSTNKDYPRFRHLFQRGNINILT